MTPSPQILNTTFTGNSKAGGDGGVLAAYGGHAAHDEQPVTQQPRASRTPTGMLRITRARLKKRIAAWLSDNKVRKVPQEVKQHKLPTSMNKNMPNNSQTVLSL